MLAARHYITSHSQSPYFGSNVHKGTLITHPSEATSEYPEVTDKLPFGKLLVELSQQQMLFVRGSCVSEALALSAPTDNGIHDTS